MKRKKSTSVTLTFLLCLLTLPAFTQGLFNNLSACYPFDCSPNDQTSNALHGIISGNITCTIGHTNLNNTAYQFGGTPGDFITLPNNSLIKPTNAITVSGWYYITSSVGQELVFTKNNNCANNFDAYFLYYSSGAFRAGISGGACAAAIAIAPGYSATNTWYHVVFYIDNNVVRLIVNNSPPVNVTHNFTFNYDPLTPVILGGTNQPASNPPFQGRMDNLRIWNRQLTTNEITDLFVNDPGCKTPIATWEFTQNLNDGMGTNDGASLNFNGTLSVPNQPTYVNDRCNTPNSAIHFNGIGDYLQMLAPGPLLDSARSLSFWMRTNNQVATAGNVKAIFNYGEWNGNAANPLNSSAQVGSRWEVCHNYSCQGVGIDISMEYVTHQDACINNNLWHHVVITQNQGVALSAAVVYIDGIPITAPWTSGCGTPANGGINTTINQLITIGAVISGPMGSNPVRFFDGDLDDFYLYDRVLTAMEVVQLYYDKCGNPPSITGPNMVCPGNSYTYTGPAGPGTYTWIVPNTWSINSGVNTNAITVTAGSMPGNIQLVIQNGCSIQTTIMPVYNNCCPQAIGVPTLATGLLTAPDSLTGPLVISQHITISGNGNFKFNTGDFIITPNVKITVKNGANLVLSDAHLYACSVVWKGIVVENGGNVTSAPGPLGLSTLIEDAVIAIDVDTIGPGHASPLLNLDGVVFNKNWLAISIHNSQLSSIPVLLKSCVFTSRDLPFSNLSWPNSSTFAGGLRFDNNLAATSLSPPFTVLSNYPFKIPKQYTDLPYGINIHNIGNSGGGAPATAGVNISSYAAAGVTSNEFNLFDCMKIGIFVSDASLTTINNTFQFPGICAIYHITYGLMNMRLSLTPQSFAQPNTGNRFWMNNWNAFSYWFSTGFPSAILAKDVYEFDMEQALFRGSVNTPPNASWGIVLNSNRFSYRIRHNRFSNLGRAIFMDFTPGQYSVNGWGLQGIYADSIVISQNYFGPQINNATPVNNGEIMGQAIEVTSANNWNFLWNTQCTGNFIQSNIIDRSQGGIGIAEMANYPLEISNNLINVIPGGGWQSGIVMVQTKGAKVVKDNVISNNINTMVGGMAFVNNISPVITCNTVDGGYTGFAFDGNNFGTWTGNTMRNNVHGLYLGSGAIIGQQGNATTPSGNRWLGNWGGGTFETFLDPGASAGASPLFVSQGAPYQPMNNSGWPAYAVNTGIYFSTGSNNLCPKAIYPSWPQARGEIVVTGINQVDGNEYPDPKLYPNPTSGNVTVASETEKEPLYVTIIDITGKTIYSETLVTKDYTATIYLPFAQGIYLVKIRDQNNKETQKKLIINK